MFFHLDGHKDLVLFVPVLESHLVKGLVNARMGLDNHVALLTLSFNFSFSSSFSSLSLNPHSLTLMSLSYVLYRYLLLCTVAWVNTYVGVLFTCLHHIIDCESHFLTQAVRECTCVVLEMTTCHGFVEMTEATFPLRVPGLTGSKFLNSQAL